MIDLEKIKPITEDKRRSRFLTLLYMHLVMIIFSSLMRLAFFVIFKEGHLNSEELLRSGLLGVLFDIRGVAIVLLPSTFLIMLPIIVNSENYFVRFIKFVQFIMIFIYQIFFAVDIGHYHYMRWRLNSSILDVFDNTNISLDMARETYPVFSSIIGLILLSVICFLCIEWVKRRYYYTGKYGLVYFPFRWERFFWILLILPLIYGKFSYFPLRWSDAFHSTNSFTNQLALNPLMNLLESLDKKNETYNLEVVKKYYPLMCEYLNIKDQDPVNLNYKRTFTFDSPSTQPHLIFIQMESMSYDKSSMSENPLDPTPYLKKMALEEGLYFPKFFTPTEATARGIFATITGIPDVTYDKSSSRNPLTSDHDLIFNQLKDYSKFYFLGGSANWGNIRGLWTSNISDIKIFEENSWKSPRIDVWGISDLNLFKESLDHIVKYSNQPTLSYIQTAGFHRPYTIPEDHETFQVRKDIPLDQLQSHGFLSSEEYNSIRFQDYSLGRFWELLKKSPIYPNVIVAIYGDHGLPSEKSLHVPKGHYQHRIVNHHVPLVILAPGRANAEVKSQVVGSMVDIVPTVLSLAQINFYTRTFGRNLLETRPDNKFNMAFLFSFHEKPKHVSIVDDKFLWLDRPVGKGLYLYESEEPLKDISAENAEIAAHYQHLADGIFETAKYMLYKNNKIIAQPQVEVPKH